MHNHCFIRKDERVLIESRQKAGEADVLLIFEEKCNLTRSVAGLRKQEDFKWHSNLQQKSKLDLI